MNFNSILFVSIDLYKRIPHKKIMYTFAQTPFGECLYALFDHRICYIAFVSHETKEQLVGDLQLRFADAIIEHNDAACDEYRHAFMHLSDLEQFNIVVIGTEFQYIVWRALLTVPSGQTKSYEQIAQQIGQPNATRAVASAIAQNKIAFLIPCHRIIRKSGELGGFRWGMACKRKILDWELTV